MSANESDPISALIADNLSARLSRRDVMKRAAALGLGATAIGQLARTYGAGAQDATPPAITSPTLQADPSVSGKDEHTLRH